MLMHGLDDLGCRDRPCARETLQKRCQAKEMIAVPVGDVNRGEVLAARDDPIQQSLRLLRREKGVHENGVALILGAITLRHRVVMAPLTRLRSDQPGDIPGDLIAEYYAQRASPGRLIVTESAEITPEASARRSCGLWTPVHFKSRPSRTTRSAWRTGSVEGAEIDSNLHQNPHNRRA